MPATTEKPPTLPRELAALERMTATELRDKYVHLFGEPAASGNRAWLARRVGWRMQALAEGDLSDRHIRILPPIGSESPGHHASPPCGSQLPAPGGSFTSFPAEAHFRHPRMGPEGAARPDGRPPAEPAAGPHGEASGSGVRSHVAPGRTTAVAFGSRWT